MTTAVAIYSEKQASFPRLYRMWETPQQLWVETASLCFTSTQIGFLRYGVLEALVSLGNAAVPPRGTRADTSVWWTAAIRAVRHAPAVFWAAFVAI